MAHRRVPALSAALLLVVLTCGLAYAEYDLTAVAEIDGAYWVPGLLAGAGTGLFEPFVRFSNKDSEYAYNSGQGKTADNPYIDASWTTLLKWTELDLVTWQGDPHIRFNLDINQNDAILSLTDLRIYMSASANLGDAASPFSSWSASDKVYDLDTALTLHQSGGGSGKADVVTYIPVTYFNAWFTPGGSQDPYIYLYSSFGLPGLYASNDGFDEWNRDAGGNQPDPGPLNPATPELSSASLLFLGMLPLGLARVRRKRQ